MRNKELNSLEKPLHFITNEIFSKNCFLNSTIKQFETMPQYQYDFIAQISSKSDLIFDSLPESEGRKQRGILYFHYDKPEDIYSNHLKGIFIPFLSLSPNDFPSVIETLCLYNPRTQFVIMLSVSGRGKATVIINKNACVSHVQTSRKVDVSTVDESEVQGLSLCSMCHRVSSKNNYGHYCSKRCKKAGKKGDNKYHEI